MSYKVYIRILKHRIGLKKLQNFVLCNSLFVPSKTKGPSVVQMQCQPIYSRPHIRLCTWVSNDFYGLEQNKFCVTHPYADRATRRLKANLPHLCHRQFQAELTCRIQEFLFSNVNQHNWLRFAVSHLCVAMIHCKITHPFHFKIHTYIIIFPPDSRLHNPYIWNKIVILQKNHLSKHLQKRKFGLP